MGLFYHGTLREENACEIRDSGFSRFLINTSSQFHRLARGDGFYLTNIKNEAEEYGSNILELDVDNDKLYQCNNDCETVEGMRDNPEFNEWMKKKYGMTFRDMDSYITGPCFKKLTKKCEKLINIAESRNNLLNNFARDKGFNGIEYDMGKRHEYMENGERKMSDRRWAILHNNKAVKSCQLVQRREPLPELFQ